MHKIKSIKHINYLVRPDPLSSRLVLN